MEHTLLSRSPASVTTSQPLSLLSLLLLGRLVLGISSPGTGQSNTHLGSLACVCMGICMCVHGCGSTYMCLYVCTCMCVCMYMCVFVYVCAYVCMGALTCMCFHVCACMHVCECKVGSCAERKGTDVRDRGHLCGRPSGMRRS